MKQPPDPLCANCGIPLSPDECHVCDECAAFYEMTDPNFRMEDEDGNSHQAAESS
jgi:predicted RNA-binding protein with PUA domain